MDSSLSKTAKPLRKSFSKPSFTFLHVGPVQGLAGNATGAVAWCSLPSAAGEGLDPVPGVTYTET